MLWYRCSHCDISYCFVMSLVIKALLKWRYWMEYLDALQSSHVMFTTMLLSLSTAMFQHWAIRTSRSISSQPSWYASGTSCWVFFSDPPPKFFYVSQMLKGYQWDRFPFRQQTAYHFSRFAACDLRFGLLFAISISISITPLYFSDNSPTALLSSVQFNYFRAEQ